MLVIRLNQLYWKLSLNLQILLNKIKAYSLKKNYKHLCNGAVSGDMGRAHLTPSLYVLSVTSIYILFRFPRNDWGLIKY